MKRQKLGAKQTIETSMKMLSKEIIVSAQQNRRDPWTLWLRGGKIAEWMWIFFELTMHVLRV